MAQQQAALNHNAWMVGNSFEIIDCTEPDFAAYGKAHDGFITHKLFPLNVTQGIQPCLFATKKSRT